MNAPDGPAAASFGISPLAANAQATVPADHTIESRSAASRPRALIGGAPSTFSTTAVDRSRTSTGFADRSGSAFMPLDWVAVLSGSVLAVVLGTMLFATLGSPIKDDIAWLLHVAREWLGGRRLYVDLVEVNPPLVVWFSAVPVGIGRLTGISPQLVAVTMAAVVVTACAWWSTMLLRTYSALFRRREPVFAIIATVLLLLPGVEFGQREHLLVAAALPYLSLFAQRLNGRSASTSTAVLVGVVAGIGCALKPQYVLSFALLETLAAVRARLWLRPELMGALAALLAYAAAVLVLYPEYFGSAVPLALALYGASDTPIGQLLYYSQTLVVGEAVAVSLWLTRPAPLRRDPLLSALLVFAGAATLTYFLEGKDWFYHRIPATSVVVLSLLYWTADTLRLQVKGGRGNFVAPVVTAACALGLFGEAAIERLVPRVADALAPGETIEAKLERIIRREHARSYMAFSQSLSVAFPVVDEAGVTWSSRFDSMWALHGELWRMRQNGGRAPQRWPVREWIARDFLVHCPDIVVVDDGDGLDYPAILAAASPSFARAWAGYAELAAIDKLRVFKRPEHRACTSPPP
jgi:hypothetical protein